MNERWDLLPSRSCPAQPTQLRINALRSGSVSSAWSEAKQGAAPTETLDFSLPKEQACEVEGSMCWKTQMSKHVFFPSKTREGGVMWSKAAQFLSFMLRGLPKEKCLSNKSEAWVAFQMFSFISDSCLHLRSNVFSLESGIATG